MTKPQQIYINPKIDFGFKIIFGQQERKEILISLLNALLYEGRPLIKDLIIQNPYLPGNVASLKDTYVDVHAVFDDKTISIVEMQSLLHLDFFKRILFNNSKKYSSQLDSGEFYDRLRPVISLVIGDFIFDRELPGPISFYEMTEKESQRPYPAHQDFRIVVVELRKFNKSLDQLETPLDMWLYFLKHAEELQEVPKKMAKVKELKSAFKVAQLANLTPNERFDLEQREMYALEQKAKLYTWATKEEIEAAIEKGERIGIEKMVFKLLEAGKLSSAEIGHLVDLSPAEIEQIRKKWAQ